MAESSQTALIAPVQPGAAVQRYRYRVRFQKAGDLRFVSHHDLMNCVERLLRRAEVPLSTSQGFHPKPKIVFALSLALGIEGAREVVELELTDDWTESELLDRLRRQATPGMSFHSVRRLQGKTAAQVRRAFYRLPLKADVVDREPVEVSANDLAARCNALFAQTHIWVERLRPHARRFDLRLLLSELHVGDGYLDMALWVTPTGAARPEEVARVLGLQELLDAGAFFERTDLELSDEVDS